MSASLSPSLVEQAGEPLDVAATLQLVADTIVGSLGFEVATINLVDDQDGDSMVVAAVCGPDEVRAALLNRRQGRAGWDTLMGASEPWGRLRFLDHATSTTETSDVLTWIPDIPISDDPEAWHPEDSLFAPLEASDGRTLGMLSVDVPRDGRRPGPATRHALEAFVVTASLAIEHAHLARDRMRSTQRFQAVFDSSPIPIALLGPDRCLQRVNDAYCAFLERSREDLLGRDPQEFTHPDDRDASGVRSRAVRSGLPIQRDEEPSALEKRYLLPDGRIVWGRLHLAPLHGQHDPGLVVAQLENITEHKRNESQLTEQAHYDALTGLPNRSWSMVQLRESLARDARRGSMTAVFFCDLDRLKLVNDSHGHATGDAYIREVSARIRRCVRDVDTVGRLSGDEFVVVVEDVLTPTEALGLAGRIIEAVREPLRLGAATFSPSLSLGIAYSGGTSTDGVASRVGADELLAQADSAMYGAKREERGAWKVYDPTMAGSPAAHLELRNDVQGALERDELALHFQPIVRLADGEVLGHEALLRWQHPRRGLLMPAEFLDVVLDSEWESPVTDWVIRAACRAAVRRSGCRRTAVNVSSLQVGRRDLPDVVLSALEDSGLDPGDLVLELTEDRLLSRSDGPELLARLSAMGVRLAIDDFGTGYAGLGYLQRFPMIETVKLDRSFVSGLGRDPVSEHIVRSVVALTQGLGLTLISEGIETREQADVLAQLGATVGQGYLFGRPAP